MTWYDLNGLWIAAIGRIVRQCPRSYLVLCGLEPAAAGSHSYAATTLLIFSARDAYPNTPGRRAAGIYVYELTLTVFEPASLGFVLGVSWLATCNFPARGTLSRAF
jgi:hypothetical protein